MLSTRFLVRTAARPLLSPAAHVRVVSAVSSAPLSTGTDGKMKAPKMVYISGEEMTNYCMNLILDKWIKPHFDVSEWEFFDLSCKGRDNSEDKVLHDAVAAGKRIGAIFKEPTVTPSAVQVKEMGLKKPWGSPNGAMRRGWNGITISRDTIHIDGMELGFKKPVFFERQAVGGEYAAGHRMVGAGEVKTIFYPKSGGPQEIVDERVLEGSNNAVVTYDNPYDGVHDLAHHFFSRCLAAGITPYVVTKKTVFKWQEMFWKEMKAVFDESYATKFKEAGLLDNCGGDLQHLISDAATMQIIRWTDGGFGMAAHNYDGDMLTDEVVSLFVCRFCIYLLVYTGFTSLLAG
jgi:isocitrate dehydrogenase